MPTVRGNCPLCTWQARDEALHRFQQVTLKDDRFRVHPLGSAVAARRQVRFEETRPVNSEDGALHAAVELEL